MPNFAGQQAIIFDDDPDIGALLVERLGGFALEARAVVDEAELAAALKPGLPSMIFLDLSLGTTDATEVLPRLHGMNFTGHLFLMSGDYAAALEAVHRFGSRLGMRIAGVLKKPIRQHELRALLQNLTPPPAPSARTSPLSSFRDGVILTEALKRDWLEFWYQPQVLLKQGAVTGVESLGRIRHPDLGVLSIGPMLDAATEEQHLEISFRACKDAESRLRSLAQWGMDYRISINIAGCVLHRRELREALIEKTDMNCSKITLEVTETDVVQDREAAELFITKAMLRGYGIAIDDFGSGYAVFDRLRQIPFNILKLDRGTVHGCARNPAQRSICAAAIGLAHDFGAQAVAEGVERPEDLDVVSSLGFDFVQGFIFAPAQPFAELLKFKAAAPIASASW